MADAPNEPQRAALLSGPSPAAWKAAKQQLIPRNLAVSSRPKPRHHTTVVTLPVVREAQLAPALPQASWEEQPAPTLPQASWEDYDSDGGEGGGFRRNRRNMSYRAAVATPTAGRPLPTITQRPVGEEAAVGTQPLSSQDSHKASVTQGLPSPAYNAPSRKDPPQAAFLCSTIVTNKVL